MGEHARTEGEKATPNESPEDEEGIRVGWRDYIALFVASMETLALPLLLLIVALVFLVFILPHLA